MSYLPTAMVVTAKFRELPVDVLTMARRRIVNSFSNGLPIFLSMSGGKDSIVLADLVYRLINEGKVDPSQLTVRFIDEEAMHEEVIRVVKDWRKKFLLAGAKFEWFCLEVKHFNCFNQLENDESFICWDREKRGRWVRPMPKFAITDHPQFRPRVDSYQEFLSRAERGGLTMTGVRIAESVQRRVALNPTPSRAQDKIQPIYDWKDSDIWKYIKEEGLDFPNTYLDLYRLGCSRRQMRLSQFFSIDTARSLVRLAEFEPGLMERIVRREPGAYLAALYWDTEMFRTVRKPRKRRTNAGAESRSEDVKDYRAEVMKLLASPEYRMLDRSVAPSQKQRDARKARNIILRYGDAITPRIWKDLYATLYAGDPKGRTFRAMYTQLNALRQRQVVR